MEKKTIVSIAAVFASTFILSACSAQPTPTSDTSATDAPVMMETSPSPMESSTPSGSPQSMKVTPGSKEATTIGEYKSPAGDEKIGFHLVVDKSGVITDASADVMATAPISKTRQTAFADGFAAAVKGKKLSELKSIDRVGGSSLTTGAFNASIAKLQAQI